MERLSTDDERESVIGGDTGLTRAQARELLFRPADGLTQRGIGPGDGVAAYVGNTPEAVLPAVAVHLLGGRLVHVPPEPGPSKLRVLIERADVSGVVVDPAFSTRLDGWDLAVHRSDDRWTASARTPPMNLLCNTLITHGSGSGAARPQFGVVILGGSPLAPQRPRQAIEKWGPVVNRATA